MAGYDEYLSSGGETLEKGHSAEKHTSAYVTRFEWPSIMIPAHLSFGVESEDACLVSLSSMLQKFQRDGRLYLDRVIDAPVYQVTLTWDGVWSSN